MNASTFDTHAAFTALRDTGLDEAPAVAIVNTVRDAAASDHADLATAIADLKADMLKVAVGVAIGIVIANATLTAISVFGAMRLLQPLDAS